MKRIRILILISCLFLFCVSNANAQEGWLTERSRHFIIYYQEGVDSSFLNKTVDYAEKFYEEITDTLGFRRYDYWLWENRAKIYIYKDKDSYVKATNMPSWSGGRAIYSTKTIESFPWAQGFFTHLLAHELGHIIFREFIGQDVNIPLWFDEGVASYQEEVNFRSTRGKALIDALKNSSLISLDKLTNMDIRTIPDQATANLFYAESESLIRYLIEKYGQYNFVRFCRLIRDEKDFDRAFKEAYPRYNELKYLEEDWRYFLRTEFRID
jgi:hypothetical protein